MNPIAKQNLNRLINHNVLLGAMVIISCLQVYNYIRLNKVSCIFIFLVTFWFPLLSFSHPWAQFSCFFIHFSNFQVSSHFSRRFLQELRKIDWKRNGFSI